MHICMAEDVTFLPRQEVLSIEEIIKLTNIFNELDVKKAAENFSNAQFSEPHEVLGSIRDWKDNF